MILPRNHKKNAMKLTIFSLMLQLCNCGLNSPRKTYVPPLPAPFPTRELSRLPYPNWSLCIPWLRPSLESSINPPLVMPDALSKTVPIWSAVLNRALFPSATEYHPVRLPPDYLGASEEAQIESRIEGFVHSLKVRMCDINMTWANQCTKTPSLSGQK